MATTLYLIRHGATEANLVQPYRLQGRSPTIALAPLGVRQAELTRDVLAIRTIDHFYSSPLKRAAQTAKILASPRCLPVQIIPELAECDVGQWEGLTWETIRELHSEAYRLFLQDPAKHGYLAGESFTDVAERVNPAFERLLSMHPGKTILVVGHQVVNRVYLAGLLGLPPSQARQVRLDNCGISIVEREDGQTRVATLNATFHLQGASAAA